MKLAILALCGCVLMALAALASLLSASCGRATAACRRVVLTDTGARFRGDAGAYPAGNCIWNGPGCQRAGSGRHCAGAGESRAGS